MKIRGLEQIDRGRRGMEGHPHDVDDQHVGVRIQAGGDESDGAPDQKRP